MGSFITLGPDLTPCLISIQLDLCYAEKMFGIFKKNCVFCLFLFLHVWKMFNSFFLPSGVITEPQVYWYLSRTLRKALPSLVVSAFSLYMHRGLPHS